ncbi:hypothetical protein HT576_22185 [Haloterrigena sp. SYSU A121-1]|uniref:Uncharacterized protein n=1 Tax=Haloterrigena gelatinilytica TaxID=2741724 RepID=A0A8J8GTF3_9EURY|nr:hypothetical protein [Haloterrigena gelatinilytica]NUB93692.1 hypothetical protein [Haloterrigena gelatinilytica]
MRLAITPWDSSGPTRGRGTGDGRSESRRSESAGRSETDAPRDTAPVRSRGRVVADALRDGIAPSERRTEPTAKRTR